LAGPLLALFWVFVAAIGAAVALALIAGAGGRL
jgi:hypothetical protein